MKPIYRWIFNHSRLAHVILAVVVTVICYFGLDPAYFSFGLRFLITFSMLFSCYTLVGSVPELLLRKPLQILEQGCDPYPFLNELELHIGKVRVDAHGQMTYINYAMALVQTGQYEKALKILERIDINQFPNTPVIAKFIYYNNLCDVLTRLNRFEEADRWYQQGKDVYDSLPGNRMKQSLERTAEMNEIEYLYRDQDYAGALRRLAKIPCPTQRSLMEAALLAARCNLGLEEFSKAREKLNYVITHANRLGCVMDAKTLLDSCPEE